MNKKGLIDVSDKGLDCYKCGIEPAAMGKPLKTPSGGIFYRGWCEYCLEGVPPGSRGETAATSNLPVKIGEQVEAVISGKFLHMVPKTNEAVILVGTRGYTVPLSALGVFDEEVAAGEGATVAAESD